MCPTELECDSQWWQWFLHLQDRLPLVAGLSCKCPTAMCSIECKFALPHVPHHMHVTKMILSVIELMCTPVEFEWLSGNLTCKDLHMQYNYGCIPESNSYLTTIPKYLGCIRCHVCALDQFSVHKMPSIPLACLHAVAYMPSRTPQLEQY